MIHVHRYHLVLRGAWGKSIARSTREGALLRFRMHDGVVGHADLFAWPELGDADLSELLLKLASTLADVAEQFVGKNSGIEAGGFSEAALAALQVRLQVVADEDLRFRLLPRLVDAARAEITASREKRPVVGGSVLNHRTVLSAYSMAVGDVMNARRGGFPAIKLKTHGSFEDAEALARFNGHWRIGLRLDCNERSDRETLLRFLDKLPIRILQQIDFLEDPFPFSVRAWSDFHRETGIRLALDRPSMRLSESELAAAFLEGAAQVYVHKPQWTSSDVARRLVDVWGSAAPSRPVQMVVTSALGHPIGNLYAASVAAELAPDAHHGCMTHTVYRDDEISNALIASGQVKGARIFGNGIGYGLPEKSLQQIRWNGLKAGD